MSGEILFDNRTKTKQTASQTGSNVPCSCCIYGEVPKVDTKLQGLLNDIPSITLSSR